MKSKKRIAVLIIFLFTIMGFGSTLYAYWSIAGGANEDKEVQIKIGEGDTVETTVNVSNLFDSIKLVPQGYEEDGVSDSGVNITFNVVWEVKENSQVLKGKLLIKTLEIKVGDNNFSHLFSTAVVNDDLQIESGSNREVTVRLMFSKEPSSPEEYFEIAEKAINVSFEFTVVNMTTKGGFSL